MSYEDFTQRNKASLRWIGAVGDFNVGKLLSPQNQQTFFPASAGFQRDMHQGNEFASAIYYIHENPLTRSEKAED